MDLWSWYIKLILIAYVTVFSRALFRILSCLFSRRRLPLMAECGSCTSSPVAPSARTAPGGRRSKGGTSMLKSLLEVCPRAAKTGQSAGRNGRWRPPQHVDTHRFSVSLVLLFCWNLRKNNCRLTTCSSVFTRTVTIEVSTDTWRWLGPGQRACVPKVGNWVTHFNLVCLQHPSCVHSASWALRLWDRVIPSSPLALTLSSWLTASSETPPMMTKLCRAVKRLFFSVPADTSLLIFLSFRNQYFPRMFEVYSHSFLCDCFILSTMPCCLH